MEEANKLYSKNTWKAKQIVRNHYTVMNTKTKKKNE